MKPRDGLHRVSVTFRGVALDCEGVYVKGHSGDHTDPPEPAMFEFTYANHRGEDMLDMLGDKERETLAECCISELESGGGY